MKHGLRKHKLYVVWAGIKQRCYYEKHIGYHNYGGRGIRMFHDWIDNSEKFIQWALENGWKEGLSIDRINNDGNYAPDNCKFSTSSEQALNRRPVTVTGVKHVYKKGDKYQVQAKIAKGKCKSFGVFNTLEEAEKVSKGKPWLKLRQKN